MPLFPTTSRYICQRYIQNLARRHYVSATQPRLFPRPAISKKRQALIQKHEFQLWNAQRKEALEQRGQKEDIADLNLLKEEFLKWKTRKLDTLAKGREKALESDNFAAQGSESRLPIIRKFEAHPSAYAGSVERNMRVRQTVPPTTRKIYSDSPKEPPLSVGENEQPRGGRLRRGGRRISPSMGSLIKEINTGIVRGYVPDGPEDPRPYAMADQLTPPTMNLPAKSIRRPSRGRIRRVRPLLVRFTSIPPRNTPAGHARGPESATDELIPDAPSRNVAASFERTASTEFWSEKQKHELKVHDHFNMYWETYPPTIQQLSRANTFFVKDRKPPQLLGSVAHFRQVPDSDVPEVAFVGRSNVGKSSLLNAVVDADVKDLVARTSATRGFTKTMNFYGVAPGTGVTVERDYRGREKIVGQGGLVLVDMPGYGEGSLTSWGVEIMKYIQSRKQLCRVFVLLDAEHGIKDKDRSLLASLRFAGVSHQVILSKMDKLYIPKSTDIRHFDKKRGVRLKPKGKVETLHEVMEKLKPEIKPPVGGGALGELLACSGELVVDGRRLGIDHVRYAVLKAVGLDIAPSSWSRPEKHQVGKGEMEDLRKVRSLTLRKELKSRSALKARREGKRSLLRRRT